MGPADPAGMGWDKPGRRSKNQSLSDKANGNSGKGRRPPSRGKFTGAPPRGAGRSVVGPQGLHCAGEERTEGDADDVGPRRRSGDFRLRNNC